MKKLTLNRRNFQRELFMGLVLMLILSYVSNSTVQAQSVSNNHVLVKSGRPAVTLKDVTNKAKGKSTYSSNVTKLQLKSINNHIQKGTTTSKRKIRKATPLSSTNAFGFSVYDASVTLIMDNDADGYYSEFELNFDVDYDNGTANVYADIYYRTAGGDWLWFYTTNDFQVSGNSSSDSYSVISNLSSDFPSDGYDFLIDIYESGVPGIVVTYSSVDDFDLSNVLLEDNGYDSAVNNALSLQTLSLNLIDDFDFDGFYTGFNLLIDLDNQSFDRNLYAILYSRDSVSGWYKEHTTQTVLVNLNETVEFSIDGLWNTGYETDYYDFLVEIVDADTGEVVVDFGPEYQTLSARKLESANWDQVADVVVVESYSAGSMGWVFYLSIVLLAIIRVYPNRTWKRSGN